MRGLSTVFMVFGFMALIGFLFVVEFGDPTTLWVAHVDRLIAVAAMFFAASAATKTP